MQILSRHKEDHKGKTHCLSFNTIEGGGIFDEWPEDTQVDGKTLTWQIAGQKMKFRVSPVGGTGYLPVMPVDRVELPPESFARIVDCLPRQKLNATNKDLWAKLAPWAPVAVIGIGAIILTVMTG